MNLKDLSLKWKTALPIMTLVAAGILVTVAVTGYKTKQIVFEEVRHSVLEGYRDSVLNALTTMMLTGSYSESRGAFLDQMKKIADVKVIRTGKVDRDYPAAPGRTYDFPSDEIEREVVENGVGRVAVEGATIRGVYPYIAKSDFMGKNCLACHKVKEGDVLGGVSITIPITGSLERIRALQYLYLMLGLLGIGSLAATLFLIVRVTHRPLDGFIGNLRETSRRYTDRDITFHGGNEVVLMANGVTGLVRHFSTMINKIMFTTSKTLPVVDIMNDMIKKTSQGARQQSEQSVRIAAAAEELSQSIGDIAKNASIAADTSTGALAIASRGKETADAAVENVREVHRSSVELSAKVEQLNNRVSEIDDIVVLIKNIADQTNLLALNAAIEAARAGDQGRGFAVVADEVRKLAERTIRATNEVSGKIGSVQAESKETAAFMGEATKKSAGAAENIGKVGESLDSILSEIQKTRDEITKIAAAVEEQSSTTEEVAKNIDATSSIAQDIEKLATGVSGEVTKLADVADELRAATAGVRTQGSAAIMLALAITDHRGFVGKIAACLKGELPLDAGKLPDHHTCRFGKWYDTEGQKICGHLPSYRAVEGPHERIHHLAREAVAASNEGSAGRAETLFREIETVSQQIIGSLDKVKGECAEGSEAQ